MERCRGIWRGEKGLGVVGRDREVCGGIGSSGEGQCEVVTDRERWGRTWRGENGQREVGRDGERWEVIGSGGEG